jgi:hypothetical protein
MVAAPGATTPVVTRERKDSMREDGKTREHGNEIRTTWRAPSWLAVLAVIVAASAGMSLAQAPSPSQTAAPAVDPAALAALDRMGAYLRTLTAIQVEAATTNEDVLEDGQKIQYTGVANLLARKPDRLRLEDTNDRYQRLYLYDGKSFTLYGKRLNFYATIPAPPTIAELLNMLETNYAISAPLADLFRWGSPGWSNERIKAAMDIGPSVVEGTTCEQYAFRQDTIDWQVWIQKGDYPLPRRLVITTKTDEARPQFTAVYRWNLAPSFNDAAFTFDPPAGAGRVVMPTARPSGDGK